MATMCFVPRFPPYIASDSIGDWKHKSVRSSCIFARADSFILASGATGAANKPSKGGLARDHLLGPVFDFHNVDLPLLTFQTQTESRCRLASEVVARIRIVPDCPVSLRSFNSSADKSHRPGMGNYSRRRVGILAVGRAILAKLLCFLRLL